MGKIRTNAYRSLWRRVAWDVGLPLAPPFQASGRTRWIQAELSRVFNNPSSRSASSNRRGRITGNHNGRHCAPERLTYAGGDIGTGLAAAQVIVGDEQRRVRFSVHQRVWLPWCSCASRCIPSRSTVPSSPSSCLTAPRQCHRQTPAASDKRYVEPQSEPSRLVLLATPTWRVPQVPAETT